MTTEELDYLVKGLSRELLPKLVAVLSESREHVADAQYQVKLPLVELKRQLKEERTRGVAL